MRLEVRLFMDILWGGARRLFMDILRGVARLHAHSLRLSAIGHQPGGIHNFTTTRVILLCTIRQSEIHQTQLVYNDVLC